MMYILHSVIFNVTLHTVQIMLIKPDRRCVKDMSRYLGKILPKESSYEQGAQPFRSQREDYAGP